MAGENIFIMNSHSLISPDVVAAIINEGYAVKKIKNYHELKYTVDKTVPDLLILEMMSATDDIYSYKEAIEKIPAIHNVPTIAVVDSIDRNSAVLLARMGFQDIIVKPIEIENLLTIIDKCVMKIKEGNFRIVEHESNDERIMVEFFKHVDASNSKSLENFIDHLIINKKAQNIIFNFKKVKYIDSSGIGVLIVCKKKLNLLGGELLIINVNEMVMSLFITLHLHEILELQQEEVRA